MEKLRKHFGKTSEITWKNLGNYLEKAICRNSIDLGNGFFK